MQLSIIFGFRDRETTRVALCLQSLARQTFTDFEVIFVDYGSQSRYADDTRALVESFDFCRYVYTDTRGRPWNRSHALNTGVRQSTARYIMTTDVDMIYPSDFVATFMAAADERKVFHVFHHLLPEGYTAWDKLHTQLDLPVAQDALGACHFVAREQFVAIGGFDELYCYWGIEDRDLNLRERAVGLEVEVLNDRTYMHHQWHPPANLVTTDFMPQGWWRRMEVYFHEHKSVVVRNGDDWGRMVTERPILRYLDFEAGSIIDRPELTRPRHMQVTKGYAVSQFIEQFYALPAGHAIAVDDAFYPNIGTARQRVLDTWNKAMRYTGIGTELRGNVNQLHSNLYPFTVDSSQVEDYYLGFEADNGVSVFLKKS